MRRSLATIALALLLALAPPAAAAHRSVPRGFFGTMLDGPLIDRSLPLAGEFDQMVRTGVESVRVAFYWSQIEPQQGVYDFSSSDAIVTQAASRGLSVLPTVVLAPAWARKDPTRMWSPPADPAAYGAFVGALAQRYGAGGTFWAQHPQLPRVPIERWQVWNEPAGFSPPDSPSVYWDDPGVPFESRYVAMLRAAHAAARAADPGARIVLAGLFGRSWDSLAAIYAHGGRGTFDVVGANVFTQLVPNVLLNMRLLRGVMRAHGDARLPLVVSELAWPSALGHVRGAARKPFNVTPAGEASNLRSAFAALAAQRGALGIEAVYWYTWATADTGAGDAFTYAGLRTVLANGTVVAKPAQAAYASVALRLEGR